MKDKIIIPKGFKAAAVNCGIKRKRPDLTLILSETEATAAGVFTANSVKAAPVVLSSSFLKEKTHRAVIINSGNANCLTGKEGLKDAAKTASSCAFLLGCKREQILVCSTGIIGKRLPLDKIKKALPELVLSLSNKNFVKASKAIMTTDTFNKICSDSIKSGKKHARILGIAKGAGMIAPNLATMISVIITDVKAPKPILEKALKESVGSSFNCVTVDGDMSTNDTVILLANGASGIDIGSSKSVYKKFAGALNSTCLTLAKMIARDGEGATKFIEINVKGAKTNAQARAVAMKVANSCLFKTMCYGEDPNFGRVAACCGAASKDIRPQAIDIYLNGIAAVKSGVAISKKINKNIFKGDEIKVAVNLNIGNKSAKVFTCDLSPEYVKINAAYS